VARSAEAFVHLGIRAYSKKRTSQYRNTKNALFTIILKRASVLSQNFAAKVRNVGRSPRTAADALVGLCFSSLGAAGPGGPVRARAPAPRNEFFNELATRDTSVDRTISTPVLSQCGK
jgi:hypothetical protein